MLTNRTEDDLLILELNVDGKKLSTGIETYYDYTTEELFLPLGSLSKSLNFPMNVQSKKGKMSGFFLDPENTFELNASEQTIKVADKKLTYPQKGIEFSNTEIFATPENIAAWFPLQIKLIYAEQRLEISSLTELPFQAYAKRRGIWENLKEKNKPKTLNAPTKVLKRGLISEPHIYGALNQVFTKSTKNEYDSNTDLNLQATADILQMTGHFNAQISHSDDTQIELDEVKATLTQVDSNGKLLGFLKSTQFELGDVDFQTPPLLSTNSSGRGVFVSNKDINAIRDPDNFVLTGNAPAGWDVEVYQNGLILDFQEVENNGSYSFTALPLKAGQNTFNVKIYGPNGEQEEYVETYFLGSETIKKGEFNYDFIATESSQDLISTQKQESSGGLISLSTEYGLLRNLSVTGGLFAGEIYRKKTEAATLGLRTALWGTDLRIDYISQKNDPSAYQINLRRNLSSNTDISLNHLNYKNYDAGDNPVDKSFGVTLNHNFSFKFNPNIQTQISYEKEQLLIGTERDLIKTRVGTQIYGINLTNELDATIKKDTDTNYNGTLSASAQFNNIDFRTRASYQIENEDIDLSQVTLGLNGQIDKNINLRSSITQAFEKGLDTTNIDSQISWRIKQADIGFNIGGNSEGNIRAGFNLSSHFVPESAGYKFKNSQIASYGGVQVDLRAFLDDNNNKIFDEGEKVLENTIFHYKKRGRIARTNSKGIATLTGLTPYIDNIILVDLLSIKDIYIKPINEKVNVVGEPYQQGLVDFPMRLEGELGGTIKYIEDIDTMPLSGIRIKLKNMNDVTIAETISEFDGYFLFTNIPMGSYTLNLNKQDLEALNRVVSIETPKVIKLNKDQPFKDGFDVLVKAKTSNSLFNETILKMQKEGTPKVSQLISTP